MQEAVHHADLIVICTPVNHIISTLEKLDNLDLENAWITDVGSMKSEICEFAQSLKLGKKFIGSHPMAGSDKSGHEYASKDLYSNQPRIITLYE